MYSTAFADRAIECERKTIRALVAEEMYYGLIFPSVKKCKTIHDELRAYLLPEQTELNV